MIKKLFNKIKNMVKLSVLKSLTDTEVHQIADTGYYGIKQEGVMYNPFGFYSKPKKGSLCGVVNIGGNESSQLVFVWNPKKRPKIADGESAIWNEESEVGIYARNDGNIEIDTESRNILVKKDSILITNKDGGPAGDIKFGSQGLLNFLETMNGVGNLSIPVPVDPAGKAILKKMLTEKTIEIG